MKKHCHQTAALALCLLILGLLASFVLALGVGSSDITLADACRVLFAKMTHGPVSETTSTIVWDLRIPRLLMAVLAGAALAASGAVMQTLFQNPLADPYVLGSASGAGLGAVLAAFIVPTSNLAGTGAMSLSAFAGALATTAAVYFMAKRKGGMSGSVLLLTGVAVGGLLQALMAYFLLRQKHQQSRELLAWLMGSVSSASWTEVSVTAPLVAGSILVLLRLRKELDLLAFGDEDAYHLGVPLEQVKLLALASSALLVAVAVAMCGVIAFVGLLVPHCARRIVGPQHGVLLPASVLLGGILLIWADALARLAIPATEIPLGVVTSVTGCLFFLFALTRYARNTLT